MSNEFGKEIRRYMHLRQLSAGDMNKLLRLSTSYFYAVRGGHVLPTVRVANRMMDLLKVSDEDRARMYLFLARCRKSIKMPMDLMSPQEKNTVARIYCKYVDQLGG
jgi:hypothetical protein